MASLPPFRSIRREIRRYRRALPKLRGLDWAAWRTLVLAQVELIRAQRSLAAHPTGNLVRDDLDPRRPALLDRIEDARRVALAVNRAADFGIFRPLCLARSIALRRLMDREGIVGADIRVGVQVRNGEFLAHAWVEYAGQVVGDDPANVARYEPLGVQVTEPT